MRSAVWTVRSVDKAFFASDTIIGIKKEKTIPFEGRMKEPLEGFLREKMGTKLRKIVLNPVRQLRKSLKVEKKKG